MTELRPYREEVVEHVLFARARARLLEDIRANQPWKAFLDQGKLQIGPRVYSAHLIGTYSRSEGTFLWSWANPSVSQWEPSVSPSKLLRDFEGRGPGREVFTQPSIPVDAVNPNELAYVAAALMGTPPVFVGTYDDGAAFLSVFVPEFIGMKLEERFPLAYIPGVLLDTPAITTADPRRCAHRFLERLGFQVQAGPASLDGSRNDGRISVTFDAAGRIAEATLGT